MGHCFLIGSRAIFHLLQRRLVTLPTFPLQLTGITIEGFLDLAFLPLLLDVMLYLIGFHLF
jgi:hypothetical protein